MKQFDELFSADFDAIDLIAYHHLQLNPDTPLPRIIIFLDEVMKAKNPTQSLHEACILMGRTSYEQTIDVLSTTLDPAVLNSEFTGSNRPVTIFPLPALKSIRTLFPEETAFHLATRFGGVSNIYCSCYA